MTRRPIRYLAEVTVLAAILLGGIGPSHSSAWGSHSPQPAAQSPVPARHIRVQGRILYVDRASDRSHPAGGLRLEVWDQDTRSLSPGELLDTAVTDANGYFVSRDIANVDPDGPTGQPEGTQDVYLKLFTDNGNVRVLDTVFRKEYSWPSYDIDSRDGLMRNVPDGIVGMAPLYLTVATRDVEALWTFVNLVEGWEYVRSVVGADPGPVKAYWSRTATEGPLYRPAEQAVYFRDADAGYNSVVLQQEAYALLHNAYGSLPTGWLECMAGPTETLTQSTDRACAFVQGLATFFALAVSGDPTFASLALRGMNLDAPTFGTAGWQNGDAVPGRIAGALWDLHDSDATVETYDRFNDTFAALWRAAVVEKPATMSEWWSAWQKGSGDACAAMGSLYQNTIDYNDPPRLTAVPDLVLEEDTVGTLDLKAFASDAECPDERLSYELTSAGDPQAGVHLLATGVISATPQANWFGSTNIRVRVSDGPAEATAAIRVVVHAVNDCPVIRPRVSDVEKKYGDPVVLNLIPHAEDVEDPAFQLSWDARLEPQDASDVIVDGRGTTTLTFRLNPAITIRRTVRLLLVVTDRDGCSTEQPLAITWTDRPNQPPFIWEDRLQKEYTFPVNHKIDVDLRGVASDVEDAAELLEWYVFNGDEIHAQAGYRDGNRQILQFDPQIDYAGSDRAILEVRDTAGATASTWITLTWKTRDEYANVAPRILRHLLTGRTGGMNATVCYDLEDKAVDPDDHTSSLRWFVTEIEDPDVTVSGQGSRLICMRSRQNYEGCVPARFVVRDPRGAEDSIDLRTCWRALRTYLPFLFNPGEVLSGQGR